MWLGSSKGQPWLQRTHKRIFLDAKMEAEVLGYRMRPKWSSESGRKNYISMQIYYYSFQFSGLFLPIPGHERVNYKQNNNNLYSYGDNMKSDGYQNQKVRSSGQKVGLWYQTAGLYCWIIGLWSKLGLHCQFMLREWWIKKLCKCSVKYYKILSCECG